MELGGQPYTKQKITCNESKKKWMEMFIRIGNWHIQPSVYMQWVKLMFALYDTYLRIELNFTQIKLVNCHEITAKRIVRQ